jgi:hypothetical protein
MAARSISPTWPRAALPAEGGASTSQDDVIAGAHHRGLARDPRTLRARVRHRPQRAGDARRFVFDPCETRLNLAPYDIQSGQAITVTLDPQDSGGSALTEWTDYVW